jgi:hypothetical protein
MSYAYIWIPVCIVGFVVITVVAMLRHKRYFHLNARFIQISFSDEKPNEIETEPKKPKRKKPPSPSS